VSAESVRRFAEAARTSAESARHAADDARRHRDEVLRALESFRQRAELDRKASEDVRRGRAEQFDTDVRRAIREEVEVAHEIQRTSDEISKAGRGGGGRRGPSRNRS
jgi:hypothetical protein